MKVGQQRDLHVVLIGTEIPSCDCDDRKSDDLQQNPLSFYLKEFLSSLSLIGENPEDVLVIEKLSPEKS